MPKTDPRGLARLLSLIFSKIWLYLLALTSKAISTSSLPLHFYGLFEAFRGLFHLGLVVSGREIPVR